MADVADSSCPRPARTLSARWLYGCMADVADVAVGVYVADVRGLPALCLLMLCVLLTADVAVLLTAVRLCGCGCVCVCC